MSLYSNFLEPAHGATTLDAQHGWAPDELKAIQADPVLMKGMMLSKDKNAWTKGMTQDEKEQYLAKVQQLAQSGKNVTDFVSGGGSAALQLSKDGTVEPSSWWSRHGNQVIAGASLVGGGILAGGGLAGAPAAGSTTATSSVPAAAADGTLPSTAVGQMAPLNAAAPQIAGGGGGGSGILSSVGKFLQGKGGDVLGAVGQGIGNATQAAGQNRINAQDQNMRGTANYEQELATRMKTEADQRSNALKDVYRAGWYDTRQASPNNTRGLQPISQQTMDVLHGLAAQGTTKLANAAQYDSNANPALAPYKPSTPSTLEKIGTYASPALSILSTVGRLFGKSNSSSMPTMPGGTPPYV